MSTSVAAVAAVERFLRSGFDPLLQGVVERSRLLHELALFNPQTDKHSILKLSFSENAIAFQLLGDDYSATFQCNWMGSGDEVGIAVPAEACLRAVRALDSELILLSVWQDRLRFSPFEPSRKLFGDQEEEYWAELATTPICLDSAEESFTEAFSIPSNKIGELLRFVSCAVGKDSAKLKYRLNAVFLECSQNRFRVIATDSYRIHSAETRIATTYPFKVLLSGEQANCLLKLASIHQVCTVQIAIAPVRIRFQLNGTQVTFHTQETEIPPYKRGIPKLEITPIVVEQSALIRALQRASALSEDRVVTLEAGVEALTISGGQDHHFLSYVHLTLDHNHPKKVVRVNADFVTDAIERFVGNRLEVLFPEADQPVVIRTHGSSDGLMLQTAVISPFI